MGLVSIFSLFRGLVCFGFTLGFRLICFGVCVGLSSEFWVEVVGFSLGI